MSTDSRRAARRRKGLPNWRIVRYADDFAVLVHGTGLDAQALREQIAGCWPRWGCRSPSKTRVVHMGEGLTFWGSTSSGAASWAPSQWYVYTFIDSGLSGR